ncbi:MAG: hypothetical protein JXB32_12670 [Deltaproteobacteria bacterium]|nr:hypothetical protein [Deltaproteobacteria bacterium]
MRLRTRGRFRWRWLGAALLVLLPFLSPEERGDVALATFVDEPAPIVARVVPVETTPGAPAPSFSPGALDGFLVVRTERFVVRAEPELTAYAGRLALEAERGFDVLQRLLGPAPGPSVELRVVSNARELAAVAPPGSPPPGWATAVMYGDHDLIVLSLTSPRSGRFIPLFAVLRHELAHLVVDRITGGRPIPRWFDEGIALWAAGDDYAGRQEELVNAAMRDHLLPLESIERGYPSDPEQVPLAYAQSLDVVSYLVDRHGRAALRQALREVGEGTPFRQAFLNAFGTTVARLEEQWRQDIRVWYRWLPALVSGTTLWALISFLLAWAYLRQRRRRQALYAEWDREEVAAERAAAPAEPKVWPDPDPKPWGGIRPTHGQGPPGGKPEAGKGPIVYHDGRYHTLH